MFERWHWTLNDVDDMEFDDFTLLADVVHELNQRDMKAREAASKRR